MCLRSMAQSLWTTLNSGSVSGKSEKTHFHHRYEAKEIYVSAIEAAMKNREQNHNKMYCGIMVLE